MMLIITLNKDDMFAKLVKTYGASSNNLVNVIFMDLTI
jgi:hypothetical protein